MVEIEERILGSLMVEPTLVAATQLPPDAFELTSHQMVYNAIRWVYDKHGTTDPVLVAQRLEALDQLDRVGVNDGTDGYLFLSRIYASVVDVESYPAYQDQIKDQHTRRKLKGVASFITEKADNLDIPVEQLLDTIYQQVFTVAAASKNHTLSLREVLDKLDEDDTPGLSTGFMDFDIMTSGLQPGEVMIVAALTSVGKSSLALNICSNINYIHQKPVLFFSPEMPERAIGLRLLSIESGIPHAELFSEYGRTGQAYKDVRKELEAREVFINDQGGITLPQLRAEARKQATLHPGLALVVVDYIQLVRINNIEKKAEEISEIVLGLKELAKSLSVPVLALSQLNRTANYSDSLELHHLKESSAIEQFADRVVFLVPDKDNDEIMKIIVKKNRLNGITGEIRLGFEKTLMKFYNR
tara:strand:- start:1055 stop:2296 length:1242 start_codon:yes stop_codon:yes gene_type:complete